jgi:CubicO group peptidase (beta-lactamase class C family)
MKIIVLYISILISFGTCTSRNSNSNKPIDSINNYGGKPIATEELETFLKKKIKSKDIPGLSIAIINNSKVVYQNNFGYANKEQNLKVTESTIFEFASLSKSIFAFFVMTFVEEGKLDLDKPLYQYLEYPDIATDERYKKITARMVLSHQSGFPNWREGEDNQQLKIKFDPGTDYLYSGEGYQYLALVLREIENTDWQGLESVFQQRIAQPLNMEHSVFIQTEYTRKNKAQPYDENANPIDWKNSYWYLKDNGKFVAPASLHSEPVDFSKWMIAVMNKQLLTKASYGELLKTHSTAKEGQYYTLGFMTLDMPYNTVFLHGGDNEGFTGGYVMDIDKKWGFVLMTNSEKGQELTNELFEFFIEE